MGGAFGPEMGRQMIEHAGRFGPQHGVMRLVPLLLFAVLIGVLVWGFMRISSRAAAAPAGAGSPSDGALESLRLRYARGEIDREDFVQRTRDLGGAVADEDTG
jgi:uncharacterized membrane protein